MVVRMEQTFTNETNNEKIRNVKNQKYTNKGKFSAFIKDKTKAIDISHLLNAHMFALPLFSIQFRIISITGNWE